MGKRKRASADPNKTPSPSDLILYSPEMDPSSQEACSHLVESSGLKHLSSIMDCVDNSVKVPNARHSVVHRHHNFNRAALSRNPRHYYGRKYFRRNSINRIDASTSHGKGTHFCSEKWSAKLSGPCDPGSSSQTECVRERTFCKSGRNRSSSLATDALSSNSVRMVCGICQKLLRKNPCNLDSSISSSDVSVVAVLVCGHVYHADCLEQRTFDEERWDPPCPLCLGLPSFVHQPNGPD